MKILIRIILSVVLVFLLISGSGIFYLTRGLEKGEALEVKSIDISALSDGTYTGAYRGGRWTNELRVEVKDHKIIGIEIVKDVLFPKPEVTEELVGKVLAVQDPNVDAVSGSTVTCKAYLKSVENALNK